MVPDGQTVRQMMFAVLLLGSSAVTGCQSTAIAIRESFGYAKREQLVDRVQEARDGQTEAKEQFASALDEFLALTRAKPTELEEKYRELDRAYSRSEDRAEEVNDRIGRVEAVATALFSEWREELDEYSSADLRRASEDQLLRTERQYDQLISAMKEAASRMDPVLRAFRDQVLFLKHNLNAQAIASLESNTAALQSDVGRLIEEMEASIAEANAFIDQMRAEK